MSRRLEPDTQFWPDEAEPAIERLGPLRRLVMFTLGTALVITASVSAGQNTAEVVAGLVLVGLVPVDEWLTS